MYVRSPLAVLPLERVGVILEQLDLALERLEKGEVALTLALPATLFGQVRFTDRGGAGQPRRGRPHAHPEVGGDRSPKRLDFGRVPVAVSAVDHHERAAQRELARHD